MFPALLVGAMLLVNVRSVGVEPPKPAKARKTAPASFSSPDDRWNLFEMPELRERFRAAIRTAYKTGQPPPQDWYWIFRAMEREVGFPVQAFEFAKTYAAVAPEVQQSFRMPNRPRDPGIDRFYAHDVVRAKQAKGLPEPSFSFRFLRYCDSARAKENEAIYHFLLNKVAPKGRDKKPPAGNFVFLVQLRDRECLSEPQYRRLATEVARQVGATMTVYSSADLAAMTYYLVHGGFVEFLTKDALVKLAKEQESDGDWHNGLHTEYVTPFYGAYVWAYVLYQKGVRMTADDYKDALGGPPLPLDLARQ